MRKALAVIGSLIFAIGLAGGQRRRELRPNAEVQELARKALAKTSGELRLAGLKEPVEVDRDEWGVAHIYARNQDDLFFAQGFVAAQDRLWQMDLWRRTGEGKLSEVLGKSAIERDKFARLLTYRGDMNREWTSYAPDAHQIVESFVHGVNAFIESSQDNLPIEFQLTGTRPEPWTPETCLTRMAGYVMTRNAATEVLRAQLVHLIGPERTADLVEPEPPTKIGVPIGLDLDGIDQRILGSANLASAPITFEDGGSNDWVVGGLLSATGKPLLANDPHRGITLPSLRYLVHLVAPGWNVIGAGEPALPGVAAGHNDRIGFGFTIVGIDQQDIVVEQTDPRDHTRYLYQGHWLKMTSETQSIRVKGDAAPVTVELHFTRHGPVIYEDAARRRAYALRWVGSEPGTAGYLASLSLDRATNWPEFLKALERWKVPSENLVYADVEGNIGWQAAGLSPIRPGYSGMLPVPGASGRYEWKGFLPVSELPRSYNPASRFIATANNNILPPGYPHAIGFDWSPPYRAERITERLAAGSRFSIQDFERLQHDEASLPARKLIPILKGVDPVEAGLRPYRDLLTSWNMIVDKESAAAALYEAWLVSLNRNVVRAVAPEKAWPLLEGKLSLVTLTKVLENPSRYIHTGDANAVRDKVVTDSLTQAVENLKRALGPEIADWRWGELHLADFKHPMSGYPSVDSAFDLRPVRRGGDANTVNATPGNGFHQNHGASFREILDVADWDRSVTINVPGQSGQPGSKHYGDLVPLWARGEYFPMLFSKERVMEHSSDKLELLPAR